MRNKTFGKMGRVSKIKSELFEWDEAIFREREEKKPAADKVNRLQEKKDRKKFSKTKKETSFPMSKSE